MVVGNVKTGIAAGASLAGTAMAYKNYGTNSNNGNATSYQQRNGGGNWQKSSTSSKFGGKQHDEAMKQMQMWKF